DQGNATEVGAAYLAEIALDHVPSRPIGSKGFARLPVDFNGAHSLEACVLEPESLAAAASAQLEDRRDHLAVIMPECSSRSSRAIPSWTLHSQTTRVCHPRFLRREAVRLSRATFPAIFGPQYFVFDFGVCAFLLPHLWPCQKQP